MNDKKFKLWNRVVASVILAVSAFTYLATIEPSASFWDCGEFIASSYKLEVGHPPGNPVFQLIARFFTIFASPEHAAIAVNAMSAICSALTIFFLYLTIVFFAKRTVRPGKNAEGEEQYTVSQVIAIFGSAAVGALAYCFSDTFWFSAVEGEVYAMSSLFTAMVFWAMTKWYDNADEPYANRWIVLISFLMGLSIGIHLLNLLTIPAIVFLFYYRKREDGHYTLWEYVKIMLLSVVIIAAVLFIVIPYLPKICGYVDLFFVNVLGAPFNTGSAVFMIALIAACFWGLAVTYRRRKAIWNTILLCFTTIVIGFSLFTIIIIRSNVMPPTNEYQPDNAFTLVRYLSREQYGSTPLLYGQYFDAPVEDLVVKQYWTPVGDKYVKADAPVEAKYSSSGKMLFPRMWNNTDQKYVDFYESYMEGKGKKVEGATHKKPTFGTNLKFFFDFQLNWMYWRYFMWNFAGRQNDIHSPSPGELFYGNWESGIPFLDSLRLGDQSDAPKILSENKGKNHYYLLPLLLGIFGLMFQFERDKRGTWLTFLLFFMTGIAIVIYLNQPPYQVRERDYAYAGSFYAFSIWIGLAALSLYEWIGGKSRNGSPLISSAIVAACLFVPALMAAENWDDHDRSNRRTAVEMASNYLNSVGKNGILITHGDNDTFPLWYAQEVEGIRTDVRICNTSLLGTDWHIEQMKYAVNESAPLPLTVGKKQYLYGTNDYVYIYDNRNQVLPISDVMAVFKHPQVKLTLQSGRQVDYLISRKISVPVNKENALKYGIVSEEFADRMLDEIILEIPADKDALSKPELFMLDLLSNYQWDRPINMLSQGGDLNIGLKDYLMYDGFSARLVPFRNRIKSSDPGLVSSEKLYDDIMEKYSWKALGRTDYNADYQNLYTFLGVLPQREIFLTAANVLLKDGKRQKALEVLDKCIESVPAETFPLESIPLGFTTNDFVVIGIIGAYYEAGAPDKAEALAKQFGDDLMTSLKFYGQFYEYAKGEVDLCASYIYYLAEELEKHGNKTFADSLKSEANSLFEIMMET